MGTFFEEDDGDGDEASEHAASDQPEDDEPAGEKPSREQRMVDMMTKNNVHLIQEMWHTFVGSRSSDSERPMKTSYGEFWITAPCSTSPRFSACLTRLSGRQKGRE